MIRILVGIPEETHRQLAISEVEGLVNLGFEITTSLYTGKAGYHDPIRRLYIVLRNVFNIIRKARKNRVDLVYLNTSFNEKSLIRDYISLLLLRFLHAKIILKLHGSRVALLETNNYFYQYIIGKISIWADGFGVLSSEEKKNFISAGFETEKLFIVKNIVPTIHRSRSHDFRVRHGLSEGDALALYIGRFVPSKRVIDVVRAISIVKQSGHKIRLLCVGDGPDNSEIRQEVDKLGLNDNIVFTGFIKEEETKEYYVNSDMLVFPSLSEGFAMAIFTSVAAGLPIITTQIRAAADYLHEPDNCFWTAKKDPMMIAEKMIYLIRHPDVCEKMSDNNRKLSAAFSKEIICEELAVIFNQLLEGRSHH